jgi:hypothetical protein
MNPVTQFMTYNIVFKEQLLLKDLSLPNKIHLAFRGGGSIY